MAMKALERISLSWRGSEPGPGAWLDPSFILLLAVHSRDPQASQMPQFGEIDVWCEALSTISFSSV